ncbi:MULTISPECIES: hypothetical protein [unclassified Flavobacterium]|jgi:hypothetical protein|uniref:hypothetical protein n=1 Tax=unclassified Flavobacterium TaxID=196869 RepID=UPI0005804A4F|nr:MULTISPECIES: hypothetical protein [unclassified Flavobacterium]KIA96102.1 hypothetical protein OA93_17490 [Flavobacterium sp. KMS]KIC01924.1 hypothetical protein OA88_11165 [Flavobacterium sp. JRM]MEA9411307.1 hypothetical protein [Flavobacterium sp. PL02]OUL62687.1 hypothetical protein B8T70_08790 [Flavobacterium sp. AJR]
MKKNIVLFVLFVLPIVAYLFFASGVNGFTTLPVITPKVADLGNWESLRGEKVSLDNKITILGFSGTEILKNRGNYFNLNEKIYQRYHTFQDLQFVVICPLGTEEDTRKVVDALAAFTDVSQWHFVFASPDEINTYYNQLHLVGKLDQHLGTPNVFIVDKGRNLRGRKEKKDYKEGYNTFHPSELSNEMLDDFKIILYEYRAALKKNHNATKQL